LAQFRSNKRSPALHDSPGELGLWWKPEAAEEVYRMVLPNDLLRLAYMFVLAVTALQLLVFNCEMNLSELVPVPASSTDPQGSSA